MCWGRDLKGEAKPSGPLRFVSERLWVSREELRQWDRAGTELGESWEGMMRSVVRLKVETSFYRKRGREIELKM